MNNLDQFASFGSTEGKTSSDIDSEIEKMRQTLGIKCRVSEIPREIEEVKIETVGKSKEMIHKSIHRQLYLMLGSATGQQMMKRSEEQSAKVLQGVPLEKGIGFKAPPKADGFIKQASTTPSGII